MGVIMLSEGTRNEKISYVLAGYGSHAERGNQECGCWSVLTIPRSHALRGNAYYISTGVSARLPHSDQDPG